MRKVLVCQHVAHEILGTLNPLFKREGFRIRYINFGRHPHAEPSMEDYSGLVILGGPMNVDETDKYPFLTHEILLIRQAIDKKIPVLGICLGAQLIAKALGATVTKNQKKEIGWWDVLLTDEGKKDPLLSNFQPTEKLFQWHGDIFCLPEGAHQLARSECCEQQAFRFGSNIYGFQFHLEVDEPMIERWLHIPANAEELEKTDRNPETIRRETSLYIDRLKALSETTFGTFIKLFGIEKKRKRLHSR